MNAEIMKIDELEDILSKCETKHIIEWIIEDPTLSQILFKRKEINNGKIQIMWDKKRDYRVIPLNKVYAYIYWQFETIPWIQVGTDRINISESFLTPIGKSLEPLLYEINIDEYIKGVEGIKTRLRTEFELTFQKLGVVKDYGDLSIDKIYSILNLLPEFTVPENITKNIYSSLIKSDYLITDIKKCKSYETFMKTGKVLCNTGFKNINESFYLDSRSICDKVAGLYNLVEIPRRQNSSNIKKLLGVNKLVLRGKVIGVPEIHPGNTLFQRDFANYKPMAFCYRIGKATKSESRRFAELTIILCTTLKAEYGGKEIELDEYDYVLKDENTFYLKIPRTLTTLDTMKHNVSFAAAISNVMCSHIGVHEPFPSFRELYGANDISRKELLLQIYENESLLEEAKSELNYSEDVKEEFIRIMTKCKGKSTREIDVSFNKLDFSDINSVENGEIIIKCFKKLGIDVHNYNFEQPTVPIDLNDYYLNKIINLKPKYENMYKTHQYRIRNMGLDEKKMLVTEFMNYENIKHNTINSVYFDYKAEFKKEIGLEFEIEKVDLVDVYNKNKSVWESSLKDLSLVNEFLTIPSNMSLIYYGELEELNKEYESLLYARLIEHEESKEVFSNNIDPVVIYPITKPLNQKQTKNSSRVKTKTGFAPPRNLEKIGFLGEKYVFEMLSNKYSNTKWASENGKSAQINPEGVAGLGYDIEYIDENGVRKFVEVKTSKGKEIVFYMSENEFDFAIKHDAVYSVYFVCEVETKKPKILVLNNLFNGNAFNLENYAIDTSREYKVMATYH